MLRAIFTALPTAVTTLASFTGANGAYPDGSLTADTSGNLFGTTYQVAGGGTVFELSDITFTLGNLGSVALGDALSVALVSDADFAIGSSVTLSGGTLIYTPGLITAAKAGPDVLKYTVTDTVTGAVTSETQTVTLSGPLPVAANDFNASGKSDLLEQNSNGALVIYTMSGLGVTAATSVGTPGANWHVVGSADFNGDGKPDILLQNDSGTIADYLMNGTAYASGHDLGNLASSWHVRGTGDFNGDGFADILVQNDNGSMVILETNGDGKADIVLHNDNGTNTIDEINGPIILNTVAEGNPGVGYNTLVAGIDLNGDGKSDLVVENAATSTLVGYTLDNTASITAGAVLGTPGVGWNMVGSNPTTFIDGTSSNLNLAATAGPDQFVLTSTTAGIHTITGFDAAQDMLALSATLFATYGALQANEVSYKGGTFINLSPTAAIIIQSITPDHLNSSNFVLR